MDLMDLAERVVGWAHDGEQVEAFAAHSRDTEVDVYQGEIETLSSAETEGIGIRVVLLGPDGARQGFAYTGAVDESSLAATLEEARDNASFGTPDRYLGLASPDGVVPVALDLYRPELATFPTERKIEMALELERKVRDGDPRIRSLRSAGYGDGLSEVAIASTTGIRASYQRTGCSISAYAIAGQGDETQTGVGYSVGRSPMILDVDEAAAMAVERACRLLGATKPESQKVTVIFDPHVTSSLLSILAGTLNGEIVLKGRSLFADRVGEEVAVASFTLTDDPTNPDAYGASPFDSEGLATRRLPLIDAGVLRQYVHNTVSARRAGGDTRSTGSATRAGFKGTPGVGCRAISIVPGSLTQAEVLRAVGDGVLVQSISGVHSGVNTISGDFSVGAEGLMVRDGALAEPVREFTIASSIQRMLKEIAAIGNDVKWLPGGSAGLTLAIEGMSLSGK